MTPTTSPSTTTTAPTADSALGLSHILANLLPATVGTPQAPERYTVSAVFTRRPSEGEIASLDGDEARAWLDEAGFKDVSLKVSDRRLELHDTNLEELAAGLAASIAGLLAQLSVEDDDRERAFAGDLARIERRERERWAAVQKAVGQIEFDGPAASTGAAGLSLGRVVSELLPAALATVDAPARYTVSVEFNRPITETEAQLIDGDRPHRGLGDAGYPAAVLHVRDRRLDIGDTSLTELSGGLAAAIAELVSEIGVEAAEQDELTAASATRMAELELARSRSVTAAAAAIAFVAA